jgi:hypothetical protein
VFRSPITQVGSAAVRPRESSDVLVSSTLSDLVNGSGLEFDDRGTHLLKGVPGEKVVAEASFGAAGLGTVWSIGEQCRAITT